MARDVDQSTEQSIRSRQMIRMVAWVAVAAVLVVLALANTQDVPVDWIFGDADLALWIVIAGSAVLGFVLGYVTRWRRS